MTTNTCEEVADIHELQVGPQLEECSSCQADADGRGFRSRDEGPFGGNSRYGDITHETSFTERSICQISVPVGF